MRLSFSKMSGAGNDFVVVERAALPKGSSLPVLARRLCERRGGVGADGLLVLSKSGGVTVDYLNADGSEAFCGNGTRCAAWWAFRRGWTSGKRAFTLRTLEGTLDAAVAGEERASVRMPAPGRERLGLELSALGRRHTVHFIDTGVPHAVAFVPSAERADVRGLGRALRFHKAFGRAGANVDFVQPSPKGLIVRTYERGVEDETLACGTGAVAAALVAARLGRGKLPAKVLTRGGDLLAVHQDARGVRLEGPARVVYTGEIDL